MKTRIVPEGEDAVFHVTSRIAFQLLNMKDGEKRVFRSLLEKQALFCGVEVLSYCLLKNHFHLLVRVRHEANVSDKVLLERYVALYTDSDFHHVMRPEKLKALLRKGGPNADEIRKSLTTRMGSISIFMKELKQRFTIWYNRKYENSGTLWAKRFDSVLVEDVKKTLQLIGAYIDLNPVRLNLCKSPEDYPFSTFGAACKGHPSTRRWMLRHFESKDWTKARDRYQRVIRKYHEQLSAGVPSMKGMNTGVIGDEVFVLKWSNPLGKPRSSKRSLPSLILEGVLYAGACALTVRSTFRGNAFP